MYHENSIYQDHPIIAWWLKLLLGGILAITLIMGLVMLEIDRIAALVMFGVTLFDLGLFYCIMPKSYQIFSDKIKIVLGGPFHLNLPFKDIRSVQRVSGSNALSSSGIRFATSTRNVIEISRPGKMSVTISPANGDLFLEQFNQALKYYLASHG